MRLDCLGNPVTTDSDQTLRGIDDFVEGFLAYESRSENIIEAADAAPENCLANAYAGMLWMMLEAPDAPDRASKYLLAAAQSAAGASWREQMNTAFLRSWVDEDLPRALQIAGQIGSEFPTDLAMVKLHQYLDFNRGDFPAMLRTALGAREANKDIAYIHGMTAFAYEQCHLLDEAERSAHRALELKRKEPWAQHALAHVHLTRGNIEDGACFLESVAQTWTGLNSFMYTHNWWHLAVFYLSQGRNQDVLKIYDERCWGVAKTYSQDQIGAVSLLARLELAGVGVGDRWSDLGAYLQARVKDTVQPFLTLQYVYGLARARRPQADRLLAATRERARSAPAFLRDVWMDVAVPAAEGLIAYARGDFAAARRLLGGALPRMSEMGGSHAQRDLFEQILLDACIRSGDLVLAQQQLELRRAANPSDVPINSALAAVYDSLGLPAEAQRARSRTAA